MNSAIVFINSNFYPIIIGAALLLWIIFIWKEWPNKDGLWLRVLVSFITILSLMCIAIKPAYEKEISEGQGVILTDGFKSELLDSLKANNKEIIVVDYNTQKNIHQTLDSLKSAVILGYGVASYDLWQFDSLPTTYLPAPPQDGLTKLQYSKTALVGEDVVVNGEYRNPKTDNVLILADPGGNTLDSLMFKNEMFQNFSLKSELKVTGNLVYNLIEKDSAGNVFLKEPLPVVVSEKSALRILIINTYPTFESKYLKNFLLSRGHELIVRNQLTKERYKFEYYNTPKTHIYGFTSDVLQQFDAVIMDVDAFQSLSSTSKNSLEKAIGETGLGLFIQPSAAYFKLPESKSFFKFQYDAKTKINLDQNSSIILDKLPYDFEKSYNVLPIFLDSAVKIGATKFIGLGKVATTNLADTYELVLKGEKSTYNKIWTNLIEAIAKKNLANSTWEATIAYPGVNEPFNFELYNSEENPSVFNNYKSEIPLLQDIHIKSKWEGVSYPRATGWNQLKIKSDSISVFNYFVFDSLQRVTIRNHLKTKANLNYFGSQKLIESPKVKRLKQVPLVWFYITFLLGIGYLWLKPKL